MPASCACASIRRLPPSSDCQPALALPTLRSIVLLLARLRDSACGKSNLHLQPVVKSGVSVSLSEFPISYRTPLELQNQFDEDKISLHQNLHLEEMKDLYYTLVRPVLVASCLVTEDPIDSPNTRALDSTLCANFKKPPVYLSSLSLMKVLTGLARNKWCYLIEFLRINRVLICENWTDSFGNLECLVHDDCITLSIDGETVYKGQCDAGYKNGKGNLCAIITAGSNEIVDCTVHLGVPCDSAPHAELWAMYVLLRRAIDLKDVRFFHVKTDSKFVDDTMCEKYPIKPNSTHQEICEAIRCMKSYFSRFHCRWEPRENLHLVDSLLKLMDNRTSPTFEEIKAEWTDYLLQKPQFRAHQERMRFRKEYINKAQPVGTITLHRMYKAIVKNCQESRIDAVANIILSLNPPYAAVLIGDHKTAVLVKGELEKLEGFPGKFDMSIDEVDGCCFLTLLRVPLDKVDRTLDVIFNAELSGLYKAADNSLCVKLLTAMDDDANMLELSPVCFLYFHGKNPINFEGKLVRPEIGLL
ncbi:uncharacterized protein LOC121054405 [Oryza brachyantha]|uniref:uncharacterized protein LOC121054405 n=1 Tax=Oryza brachyantha TaxID=4533 RepID=UPI001AD9E061|nr:uncharacterized protein LOC121054405 [Oryza brachyantha]